MLVIPMSLKRRRGGFDTLKFFEMSRIWISDMAVCKVWYLGIFHTQNLERKTSKKKADGI